MQAFNRVQDFSVESARLHARLPSHRRAVDRALSRIRQATAEIPGTWAVACSGGKDSVAMLDLAVEAGWRGPVFHFTYEEEYEPEPLATVTERASHYGLDLDLLTVVSEFAAFDRVGHFFQNAETPEERAAVRWWEATYRKQIAARIEDRGWAGLFIGMRKDEGRTRSMMLSKKGHRYTTQGRLGWTCCPILDLSGRDVWGRIAARGLPYLDRYDAAVDRIRERSEDTWLSVDVWRFGMGSQIKSRDPALWARLCSRFPGLDSVR